MDMQIDIASVYVFDTLCSTLCDEKSYCYLSLLSCSKWTQAHNGIFHSFVDKTQGITDVKMP